MAELSLTVADTALSLTINDSNNLLAQCLAADLPVARSCRNGNCGRCDCQLEIGSVTLRNGSKLIAPCTIALCISHARSNLRIQQLPLAKMTQHWRCEGLNSMQLRLPAGRQQPPKQGDMVALLLRDTVYLNSVAKVYARIITLQDNCPEIDWHKNNQLGVGLLIIDRHHHGDFALWYQGASSKLLWQNINQQTGLAAQLAYRSAHGTGQYLLQREK